MKNLFQGPRLLLVAIFLLALVGIYSIGTSIFPVIRIKGWEHSMTSTGSIIYGGLMLLSALLIKVLKKKFIAKEA